MKITKAQLLEMIKEEVKDTMAEATSLGQMSKRYKQFPSVINYQDVDKEYKVILPVVEKLLEENPQDRPYIADALEMMMFNVRDGIHGPESVDEASPAPRQSAEEKVESAKRNLKLMNQFSILKAFEDKNVVIMQRLKPRSAGPELQMWGILMADLEGRLNEEEFDHWRDRNPDKWRRRSKPTRNWSVSDMKLRGVRQFLNALSKAEKDPEGWEWQLSRYLEPIESVADVTQAVTKLIKIGDLEADAGPGAMLSVVRFLRDRDKLSENLATTDSAVAITTEEINDDEKQEMLAQLSSMAKGTDDAFWNELKKLLSDAEASIQLESDNKAHLGGETAVPIDEKWKEDSDIKQLDKYGKAEMTKAELCKRRAALRDKKERTDAESTELRRINFALRSRQKGSKFGKVDC